MGANHLTVTHNLEMQGHCYNSRQLARHKMLGVAVRTTIYRAVLDFFLLSSAKY